MKKASEIVMLVLLLFAAIIFATALYDWFFGDAGDGISLAASGDRIGLVEIKGVILDSESTVRTIKKFRDDKNIKAIVVRINSPGGGVAASQEIYQALRNVRDAGKPLVASMSSVAASGGYYIACAADTIVANPGTTTGSIGVIMSTTDFSELLNKIGIRYNIIKSGKFKDAGSFSRRMTEEERAYFQQYIDDAFSQFVDVVAKERNMTREQVLGVADGRVYTGNQAHQEGLVDILGTFEDAVNTAASMAGIEKEPRIVRSKRKRVTFFDLFFQDVEEIVQTFSNLPVLRYQLVY